jgi:hypothetical protein
MIKFKDLKVGDLLICKSSDKHYLYKITSFVNPETIRMSQFVHFNITGKCSQTYRIEWWEKYRQQDARRITKQEYDRYKIIIIFEELK